MYLLVLSTPSPLMAGQAAVASAHPLATAAGESVLRQGGNAFDAAIAVSAALAVVEPYGSGLGGGGFWLLRDRAGKEVMIDGRERAPLAAHRDLYLDDKGQVIDGLSVDGPLAAGIPGVPAALDHLQKNYASLPMPVLLAPAIRLAEKGFPVDEEYRRYAGFRQSALRDWPSSANTLLHSGMLPEPGSLILQPDLAKTLLQIAIHGRQGFYAGEVGDKLVASVRAAGGIWQHTDLLSYQVVEREPVHFEWQGMRVSSAALPSSGGLVMAGIFGQLAATEMGTLTSVQRTHALVEAMRRAYFDRARFMGDADFTHVPQAQLKSASHAAAMHSTFDPAVATPSATLGKVAAPPSQGDNTTHFSVLDGEGNMVSATLSVNYPFGSGFIAAGTGVLLNNEMDDFSIKPGVPNAYGLVGNEANAIEPGKRMLSSMSPTILESGDRLALMGTPGGSRIITMVTLGAMAFHEGASARQIVDQPRFHHQYLPDRIQIEPDSMTAAQVQGLETLGHRVEEQKNVWGNMQVISLDRRSGQVEAASDLRGIGNAVVIRP